MDENQTQENQGPMEEKGNSPTGPVVGVIIVVAVLVIGAFYFWGEKLNVGGNRAEEKAVQEQMSPEDIRTETDPTLEQLVNQNESDELADIEADLNATELDTLDQELDNLNLELNY